jgi:hypothetical protein
MLIVWTGMFIIALLQLPILINKKQWKELASFAVLWIIAGIYASLILGTFAGAIAVPNHSELLNRFFTALYSRLGI